MAKKTVNSDIYNLSQLVDDVKSVFIPDEKEQTLAIGTYGYIGALEAHRLQTQVQMTGELCNEVFPSRARLERNIITHAIMTNIEDINAIPSKMTAFLAIKEADIENLFDEYGIFVIDRECPLYIGDYEFHLEYDIKLKRVYVEKKKANTYTAQYDIPHGREVPTSNITTQNQYLNPPVVTYVGNEPYIYLTVVLSQVEHQMVSKKLVTSNIIDNKTMNFEFEDQLAYFEVHCVESDEEYYILPVFEGSAVPETDSQYYCWYQYIDTNLIRVRFDRQSYMPGLNANIECLIKTCKGASGNFTYGQDTFVELQSSADKYNYSNVTALLTPVTDAAGGRDRKSKKELQALIPKEALSRGSLTTITDLNNYFSMLDSEYGRIVIQKKIDNQIERVYYAYFVAKDPNGDVIPSNTLNARVELGDLIESKITEVDSTRYLLPAGTVFKLGEDGIAYVNKLPLLNAGYQFTPNSPVARGKVVTDTFTVEVTPDGEDLDAVSCSVNVDGCETPTHIFPNEGDDRFGMVKSKENTIVEDYIQMGVGQKYTYTTSYTTKQDNSIITARDKTLGCFDFEDAYYSINGATKHFTSLPITAYDLPAGTKITFGITRRLNQFAKGIITFTKDGKIYKLHQKMTANKLSTILNTLGISSGEVTSAIAEDSSILNVIESGTINDEETPVLMKSAPLMANAPAENGEENPYTLNVVKTENLPDIKDRKENEWFYAVNKAQEIPDGQEVSSNMGSKGVADNYKLTVANESELPPVSEREEDHWYYAITGTTPRETEEDDPDVPDDPGDLTGKEYRLEFLKNFDGETKLVVEVGNGIYEITITQDRFNIENGIYVTEAGEEVARDMYTTFTPVLEQNIWPEELKAGTQITYTLRYKSISNKVFPLITIKLSDGLDYTLFTNLTTYPDGSSIAHEPVKISLLKERGFIYTNPYAANINGYRLYSAFYMMSMDENPYLKFDYINDKSNVQFISTNARWTRPFSGKNKNKYILTTTMTQSVLEDIGLVPADSEVPLVKAYAVFKRNGKEYRYRSMNMVNYDPSTYEITFSQDFDSADIFDNDNNIRVTNVQVAGQAEYTVKLTYENGVYTLNNGGTASLKAVMTSLQIDPIEIKTVESSDNTVLSVYPVYAEDGKTIVDYTITSLIDFPGENTITITGSNDETIVINATSTQPAIKEYGFFNPTTDVKIYVLCGLPDTTGVYSRNDFDSICPGLFNWTLTNTFEVANGVTFYHNYSEIMGSRVTPYGEDLVTEDGTVMNLEGYQVDSLPMLGYDYCQDETLVQSAINALNYRKAYIDSAAELLENSFGVDFKLFNTYGPSNTYYVIKDSNVNGVLDDDIEFIDKVNLTFYFRIKLVAENDSYTRGNIIEEIKSYIEDLDDLGELHIPNLVTQITNNYKEQISYFEYLGFNDYGPDVQHIYKVEDKKIPIHTAPEFLCVNNVLNGDGTTSPDINIYVSEI